MAFEIKNFSPIGGQARLGNSPAHWSYESPLDTLEDIKGVGYFDEIATQVKAGDFINTSLADGKAIVTLTSSTDFPKEVVIDPDSIGTGGGGAVAFPIEIFVGVNLLLGVSDNLKFIVMRNPLNQTVTIPENAVQAFPIGAEMEFLRDSATGTVTFAASGAAVLQSRDSLFMLNAQYSAATVKKIGTDEWRLIGDLV